MSTPILLSAEASQPATSAWQGILEGTVQGWIATVSRSDELLSRRATGGEFTRLELHETGEQLTIDSGPPEGPFLRTKAFAKLSDQSSPTGDRVIHAVTKTGNAHLTLTFLPEGVRFMLVCVLERSPARVGTRLLTTHGFLRPQRSARPSSPSMH